jgi:hypothetical protein
MWGHGLISSRQRWSLVNKAAPTRETPVCTYVSKSWLDHQILSSQEGLYSMAFIQLKHFTGANLFKNSRMYWIIKRRNISLNAQSLSAPFLERTQIQFTAMRYYFCKIKFIYVLLTRQMRNSQVPLYVIFIVNTRNTQLRYSRKNTGFKE